MMSAVRKQNQSDMSDTDHAAASPAGFGKMLNSLQGLQQRLEDFSIADVTNAEANARNLILRLKQFQNTIAAIALLKNAAATINRSIAEIQQLDCEVVDMNSLENHPQLHAIVKANKLIKSHKLMAALKTGANVGEPQDESILDSDSAVLAPVERSADFPSEIAEATGAESVDYDLAGRQETAVEAALSLHELAPAALDPTTIVSSEILETAADATITAPVPTDTGPLNTVALADFPTAEAEFEIAVAAATGVSSIAEVRLPDFTAPAEPPKVDLAMNLPQPVKPKQDSQIAPVKKSKTLNKKAGQLDPSKALVTANESFDLRLLDDLVSNYGEFVSNPNLPATVNKKALQPLQPAAAENQGVPLEDSGPVEAGGPVVKKHGDLDRQLKKIIKDYGEYDLYSDKQTTNIKKAGILAFVFLGLVFGGIYLFKAPPSTAKTAPVASNSGSTVPDARKTQPGAAETDGPGRESALGTLQKEEKPAAKNK
jgi:hypothetical protein